MATIHQYLNIGLEVVSTTDTHLVVKKLQAGQIRPITLKKPEGFPRLPVGHQFLAEKLRRKIYFYYY